MEPFDILKEQVTKSLEDAGAILSNSQQEVKAFFSRIEPDFNQAIAVGDTLTINTLRDRIALMLGRVSFKTMNRYRQTVLATTMTVVRILIALK